MLEEELARRGVPLARDLEDGVWRARVCVVAARDLDDRSGATEEQRLAAVLPRSLAKYEFRRGCSRLLRFWQCGNTGLL